MSCIDSKSPQRLQPLNPIALGYGIHTLPVLQTFEQFQQHQFDAVATSSLPTTMTVGQPESDAGTNNLPSSVEAAAGQPGGASESNAVVSDPNVGVGTTLAAPTVTDDPARAAYLAYQAEYYAKMMAQQQQQQAVGGSSSSLAASLLASDQLPLPLPPTSKKFAVRETPAQPQQQGDLST